MNLVQNDHFNVKLNLTLCTKYAAKMIDIFLRMNGFSSLLILTCLRKKTLISKFLSGHEV